ncbi:MAG: hypothetical protein HQL60_08390, partial [Magnetococcales bacterium]|nr:hypothetical protein [Magnetococcales bacterium]
MMMVARPQPARWLQLLAVSEDLPAALVARASHSPVEPEWHHTSAAEVQPVLTPELSQQLRRFEELSQNFRVWWPAPEKKHWDAAPGAVNVVASPMEVLGQALAVLEAWRGEAMPLIQRYQQLRAQEAELVLLTDLAMALGDSTLNLSQLGLDSSATLCLTSAVFVLPVEATLPLSENEEMLSWTVTGSKHRFLVAVAPHQSLSSLSEAVVAANGRALSINGSFWDGTGRQSLPKIEQQRAHCYREVAGIKKELRLLGQRHHVAWHLRRVARLQWFFRAVTTVSAGEALSRLEGWIGPEEDSIHINQLLDRAG